jgi:SAM-dependent methyltransferase
MGAVAGYGEDLAAIHADGFTAPAAAAAREVLARLDGPARIVDLGCGDGTKAALLSAAGHAVHGIDASPALIALARERAPDATFAVGSFVDAELPRCDAVLAVSEVLGYALDPRYGEQTLDAVFARVAGALRRGGLFLFDLAGPGRMPRGGRASVRFGDGWAVLAESRPRRERLHRRIVAFRDGGDGRARRTVEHHRLLLYEPAAVLGRLYAAGFTARALRDGYAGAGSPPGVTTFAARRR